MWLQKTCPDLLLDFIIIAKSIVILSFDIFRWKFGYRRKYVSLQLWIIYKRGNYLLGDDQNDQLNYNLNSGE